ncbi:aTP-dependent zinc metalloprotease FtsH [Clostridium sp. CAG:524]|jgi:cell division protease FtsH|nr:aTP-dependent zinc metalloprotease FtsH [Clostridium sp. CAG:524]
MNIKKTKKSMNLMPYIVLTIVVIGSYIFLNSFSTKINKMDYNELTKEIENNNVKELVVTPKNAAGVYILSGKLNNYGKGETFTVTIPYTDTVVSSVYELAESHNLKVQTNTNPENSTWLTIVVNIVPIIIFGVLAYVMIAKLSNNGKGTFDFSKSRAKLSEDGGTKTFKDVAGLKEEKEEVQELIDFLKNPKKFTKMGARIPKGVLLVGPPGTGKTLLAKAVAGEAKVPFFYISGSDFVELFVGVGASRVRDMFKQAKQTAPCLIFIDEIDAVGRERGTGVGGGHDEREQTLNQLLSEMDGFSENEGIIIIAATNRPDVLDPALLRPGRFDRQVTVGRPDVKEREEILKVHAKNKILAPSVKLKAIAERTPGYSGADLENLLNEAALLAVRRDKNEITMDEIDEASDRVLMGPAKTSRKVTDYEKKIVSYHEAGHAVSGIVLPNGEEVHKITIIPRGMAGGYTQMLPKEERTLVYTKKELEEQIITLLSGRVSEETFLGEISTGASDDLKRATKIARSMVTEYGMSSLGAVQLEHRSESVFLGRDYNQTKNFSDQVALEIDKEVRKIIDECYKQAQEILKKHKNLVEVLAKVLSEKETLTKEEIEDIVEANSDIKIKREEKLSDEIKEEEKENKFEKETSKKTKKQTNKDEE